MANLCTYLQHKRQNFDQLSDQLCAAIHKRRSSVDCVATKVDVNYFSISDDFDAESDRSSDGTNVRKLRVEWNDFDTTARAPSYPTNNGINSIVPI